VRAAWEGHGSWSVVGGWRRVSTAEAAVENDGAESAATTLSTMLHGERRCLLRRREIDLHGWPRRWAGKIARGARTRVGGRAGGGSQGAQRRTNWGRGGDRRPRSAL
jgi:hypothetical protein